MSSSIDRKKTREAFSQNKGPDEEPFSYVIVYLDDDTESLTCFREITSELGIDCHPIQSPEQAITFLEAAEYKTILIVSNIMMFSVSEIFRKRIVEVAPEVPFLVIRREITTEVALKGIDLKIAGFVESLNDDDTIFEIIHSHCLPRIETLKEEQELLNCFLTEAADNLEQAEELALLFETNPQDLDAVNKCFGLVHTLKGASGYFKPKTLHHFVHKFEDVLKKIQNGEMALNQRVTSSILAAFDIVKKLLHEFKIRKHAPFDMEKTCTDLFTFTHELQGSENNPAAGEANEGHALEANKKEAPADIRVPLHTLDDFMQTSSTMTVIRNMINKCVKSIEMQFPKNKDVDLLAELLNELHNMNAKIQCQITDLRKVPIRNILKPIPRVIRDVCKTLGKGAVLITEGDSLCVDTAIAEILNKCIIHLIRNSLDHGLEKPEKRVQLGKQAKGKITIRCQQKNEIIRIEISDDGQGINEQAIRTKLLKNGTRTPEQINALGGSELYATIFEAGFSTAEQVTDISGRGVGMSMVKDCITVAGGQIEIISQPQKGSTFTLILPVPKSVLIRNCLFVHADNLCFGIPQDDIVRILTIDPLNSGAILKMGKTWILNYQNGLIPILPLSMLLEMKKMEDIAGYGLRTSTLHLVLIHVGKRMLAIQVDAILEIEDTVIKLLNGPAKKLEVYEGATFMADGKIGLILSAEGLLDKAGIQLRQNGYQMSEHKTPDETLTETTHLIIFKLKGNTLYAIPQACVYRIEELHVSSLSKFNQGYLMPYRDRILTIMDLQELMFKRPQSVHEDSILKIIVIESKGLYIGLLVDEIIDITSTNECLIHSNDPHPAMLGYYIVQNQTVTMIDIDRLLNEYCTMPDGLMIAK